MHIEVVQRASWERTVPEEGGLALLLVLRLVALAAEILVRLGQVQPRLAHLQQMSHPRPASLLQQMQLNALKGPSEEAGCFAW